MVREGVVRELSEGHGLALEIPGSAALVDLTAAVSTACELAEDRSTPPVVVLTLGTTAPGRREWPGEAGMQDITRWERAVRRFERLPALSIAVADGTCGGPALDLLLASDYRIVGADMQLLLPVNDGQLWPGMALYRLGNQVGLARARRLALWGSDISADTALDIGLVDEIATDVAAAVQAASLMLSRVAGVDLAIRRQRLLEAPSTSFDEALGLHLAACDRELRRMANGQAEADGPPEAHAR